MPHRIRLPASASSKLQMHFALRALVFVLASALWAQSSSATCLTEGSGATAKQTQDKGASARFSRWVGTLGGLNQPSCMGLDSQQNLWVGSTGESALLVFEKEAWQNLLRAGQAEEQQDQHLLKPMRTYLGVCSPAGLAWDPAGTLFVANRCTQRIELFQPWREDQPGSSPGSSSGPSLCTEANWSLDANWGVGVLSEPRGLHWADDRLYVVDGVLNRVFVFGTTGATRGTLLFQLPSAEYQPAENSGLPSLAAQLSSESNAEPSGPAAVPLNGLLNSPSDVVLGPGQRVFVSDSDQHRVLQFDLGSKTYASIGAYGYGAGTFSTPSGLGIFDGKLLATDSNNHRIQIFDADPQLPQPSLLTQWGLHAIRPREGQGFLHYPQSILAAELTRRDSEGASSSTSVALVLEQRADRLQFFVPGTEEEEFRRRRFDAEGTVSAASPHFGAGGSSMGPWMTLLAHENHAIGLYDLRNPRPVRMQEFGGVGSALGQFRSPVDALITKQPAWKVSSESTERRPARVLVSDRGNYRLQWFQPDWDESAPPTQISSTPKLIKSLDFRTLQEPLAELGLPSPLRPGALARDRQGRIYVATDPAGILVFDHKLRLLDRLDTPGSLGSIASLAVLPAVWSQAEAEAQSLWAVDSRSQKLVRFGPLPSAHQIWQRPTEMSFALPGLKQPIDVAAFDGQLFVLDRGLHQVWRMQPDQLDQQGNGLQLAFGGQGLAALQLFKPGALFNADLDGQTQLCVVDQGNHRLQFVRQNSSGDFVLVEAMGARLFVAPTKQ